MVLFFPTHHVDCISWAVWDHSGVLTIPSVERLGLLASTRNQPGFIWLLEIPDHVRLGVLRFEVLRRITPEFLRGGLANVCRMFAECSSTQPEEMTGWFVDEHPLNHPEETRKYQDG